MSNIKYLLLLSIVIVLSSFAHAGDGEKQQSVPLNIIHTVSFNGIPTTSASCNITVFDPDNNVIVSAAPMTAIASSKTYNYTLNASQNSKIGDLCYDVACVQSNENNTEHFCIPITTTGKAYTTADSLTNLLILIVSICLFCLFIWIPNYISMDGERNEYGELVRIPLFKRQAKVFLYAMAYLTFVWLMYVIYNLTLGYSQLQAVSSFFWFVHRVFFVMLWPFLSCYVIISLIMFFKDFADIQKIKRGLILE